MLYLVLFEDDPALGEEVRRRHMAAHLAFLERNAAQVKAAGPLREADAPAGGAWLVESDDADAVGTLVRADPFWPTGLRRSVRVLAWHRVYADGRRLIDPPAQASGRPT